MVTSVRLDSGTEQKLSRLAKITGQTRSELIRQAIHQLTAEVERQLATAPTAYSRLAGMVGKVNLGPGRRAARSEQILRRLFASRRRRR